MGYENKTLPLELGFYVPFNWDNKKIWALDLPSETAFVNDWVWHLNLPFWSTIPKQPLFNLKPSEVLEYPEKYVYHSERIRSADTSYPIETFFINDRWVILDGIHRLARLVQEGVLELRIRRVPGAILTPPPPAN